MKPRNICFNCFHELEADAAGGCPHCGYRPQEDQDRYPLALPHGTVLNGRYITGRVLGQGGFGVTYIASDWKKGERVAIKEYLPDTMATRTGCSVSAYSGERRDSFEYGKECFLKEAQTLAEFIGNPHIVRVHSYFEEYGTAYFVMDYVEGTSFQDHIRNKGGRIPWQEAQEILFPVMDALEAVHAKGIIHRDVTPDNIFITGDGTVKLLDFGAARYSLGDRSRSLDVVLKHGFAPKEQYTRHGRQGPYTDVYTVAASFYYAVSGRKPVDSIDRLDEDDLVPPSRLGIDLPVHMEDAILKGMGVQPADRYQGMAEFKKALLAGEKGETQEAAGEDAVPAEPAVGPVPPSVPVSPEKKKKLGIILGGAAVGTAFVALIIVCIVLSLKVGNSGESRMASSVQGGTETGMPGNDTTAGNGTGTGDDTTTGDSTAPGNNSTAGNDTAAGNNITDITATQEPVAISKPVSSSKEIQTPEGESYTVACNASYKSVSLKHQSQGPGPSLDDMETSQIFYKGDLIYCNFSCSAAGVIKKMIWELCAEDGTVIESKKETAATTYSSWHKLYLTRSLDVGNYYFEVTLSDINRKDLGSLRWDFTLKNK